MSSFWNTLCLTEKKGILSTWKRSLGVNITNQTSTGKRWQLLVKETTFLFSFLHFKYPEATTPHLIFFSSAFYRGDERKWDEIIKLRKQTNKRKLSTYAAAASKSLQSCPTLCDPIDGSPPGSPVPGILQARTLEWVATSFSNAINICIEGKYDSA